MRILKYSYRSADEILLTKPDIMEEIDTIIIRDIDLSALSRSHFDQVLKEIFISNGWQNHPSAFNEPINPFSKIELIKDCTGLEFGFRHASLTGHNLLKFQLSSAFNSDKIDVGIFVVTTANFQKQIKKAYRHNWVGAMTFEKVDRYLRHFKTAIEMPIYLVGIDVA